MVRNDVIVVYRGRLAFMMPEDRRKIMNKSISTAAAGAAAHQKQSCEGRSFGAIDQNGSKSAERYTVIPCARLLCVFCASVVCLLSVCCLSVVCLLPVCSTRLVRSSRDVEAEISCGNAGQCTKSRSVNSIPRKRLVYGMPYSVRATSALHHFELTAG